MWYKKDGNDYVTQINSSPANTTGWTQIADEGLRKGDKVENGVVTFRVCQRNADRRKAWKWALDDLYYNDLASYSTENWENAVRLGRRDLLTDTEWDELIADYDAANP